MIDAILKLNTPVGTGYGSSFNLTVNTGTITPTTATLSELTAGLLVTLSSSSAASVTVTPAVGGCTPITISLVKQTTTTSTSTTSTTTCPPQYFTMQVVGITQFTIPSNEIVSTGSFVVEWQPGVRQTIAPGSGISHTYGSAYTGDIKIIACDLSIIQNFNIYDDATITGTSVSIKDSEVTKLTSLITLGLFYTKGTTVSFVHDTTQLNSSTKLLPRSLTRFVVGPNNANGSVVDLPPNLIEIQIFDNNTLSGNVADLPRILQNIQIGGLNTIGGLVGDMPDSTVDFVIFGNNTIHGNLSDIPGHPSTPTVSNTNPNLVDFNVLGNNYIHGDLSDMNWKKLIVFNLAGKRNQASIATTSYLTGDIDTLPTISVLDGGDGVRPFRTNLQVFGHVYGYNTITGNVNKFPPAMRELSVGGEDTFSLGYGNTLYGNLSDVPKSNMDTLYIYGKNTITGTLASYLPAPKCDVFNIAGLNTISGDLKDLPPYVRVAYLTGRNTVNRYSVSRPWRGGATPPYGGVPNSMATFYFDSQSTGKLTIQSDINNLITDLNNTTNWHNYSDVNNLSSVRVRAIPPTGTAVTALAQLDTRINTVSFGTNHAVVANT